MIKDFRKLILAGLLTVFVASTGCGCKNDMMNKNSYKPMPNSQYQDDSQDQDGENNYGWNDSNRRSNDSNRRSNDSNRRSNDSNRRSNDSNRRSKDNNYQNENNYQEDNNYHSDCK